MANIIDTSYFVGDIEIANSAQEEIAAGLTNSIKLYEKEVLIQLLGYALYKELVAAPEVVDDKWYKLINGEDFTQTINGESVESRWEGLKGLEKKSLIAYYVYFMYRRKTASYNAGTGAEVKPAQDNSEVDGLYEKLVYIWNEFIAMYGGEGCDEGRWIDEEHLGSAYNYLLAKTADFPTWRFTEQGGEINVMGV